MAAHYVYKFISIYNQVLYVGETNNIDRRIREHLSCNPSKTNFRKSDIKKIHKVEYLKLKSSHEGKLVEKYYILKYLSPVLKNKSIPRTRIEIKNPPSNWRTLVYINKKRATNKKYSEILCNLLLKVIFWIFLLYYIVQQF
jgi:predicted GIY-YIG superfamily endonuclease